MLKLDLRRTLSLGIFCRWHDLYIVVISAILFPEPWRKLTSTPLDIFNQQTSMIDPISLTVAATISIIQLIGIYELRRQCTQLDRMEQREHYRQLRSAFLIARRSQIPQARAICTCPPTLTRAKSIS